VRALTVLSAPCTTVLIMEKPVTVAVVDDDPEVREAYRVFFSNRDEFELIGVAADGADGVALYREKLPDVMLMDLKMPVMSGVDAIEEICHRDPAARVIALTTFSTDDMITAALRAGAAGYLLKDCGAEDLTQGIHQAIAGEMPLSPAVRLALVESLKANQDTSGNPVPQIVTNREAELLKCLARGMSNKEISDAIYLSEGSVKQYLTHIADKFGVHSRTQVLVRALQLHIIDLKSLSQNHD